jgi:hypothetical protein
MMMLAIRRVLSVEQWMKLQASQQERDAGHGWPGAPAAAWLGSPAAPATYPARIPDCRMRSRSLANSCVILSTEPCRGLPSTASSPPRSSPLPILEKIQPPGMARVSGTMSLSWRPMELRTLRLSREEGTPAGPAGRCGRGPRS